jgi:hypothetical protein
MLIFVGDVIKPRQNSGYKHQLKYKHSLNHTTPLKPEIGDEISYGTIHHLVKMYQRILDKHFWISSMMNSRQATPYTKYSTATLLK